MLVALAGGVGAARLLAGMVRVVDPGEVTAVVNTGDDLVLHGLHVSPDIDTIIYTLAGLSNAETGWGLAGETWTVMSSLEDLGGEAWFRLGDRDLATHLFRSQRLADGASLSQVTSELARARGLALRVLPATDDPVRTRLTLAEPVGDLTVGTEVAFQHYFVRLRHSVAVQAVRFDGADTARPAPGVLEALAAAEVIVACPSNPVVSLGPILAVPGVRDLLAERRDHVVAVSPIVAGAALKGPADRMLTELGYESSAAGVARMHAEWAGTMVVDRQDAALAPAIAAAGVRPVVAPTVMTSPDVAAALCRVVLDAAR